MQLTQETLSNPKLFSMEENQSEMFEVLTQLQRMCWAWLNADASRTKLSLAYQVGVSEASVRRVLNEDKIPNADNLMKFVRFFGNGNRVGSSIDRMNGALADQLAQQLPMSKWQGENELRDQGRELANKLNSEIKKLLFVKAIAQDHGISEEEIQNEFGAEGGLEAQEMLQDQILEIRERAYVLSSEASRLSQKVLFSQRFSKQVLCAMIAKYYKVNQSKNLGFWHVASVNQEGYEQIQNLLQETLAKIHSIAEKNVGDTPVFSVAVTDVLKFKEPSKTPLL